ncbi:MAG: hypothetical protein JXA18_12815 [Chitinispirillaceae bacterium]|nr:hypothetical protein [Chitinispirillaceae bacterium]
MSVAMKEPLRMNTTITLSIAIAGVFLCNFVSFAEEEKRTFVPELNGYASVETGEIMKGYSWMYNSSTGEVDHGWVQRAFIGLCADVAVNDRFRILVGAEGMLNFSFNLGNRLNDQYLETQRPLLKFSIWHGEGVYSFGDLERPLLQVEAGFFPYKYNAEARNFGEYLFRTGCYPGIIINRFDRAYADLLGVRVGNTIGGRFNHHLFLTSEITDFLFPPGDFSLSYIADFSLPGILTVGGGTSLYRLLSINKRITTPKDRETAYSITNVRTITDDFGNPAEIGDTSYLSFSGIKLMGRLSFDIKGVVPLDFIRKLFGEEDLKLYCETAVLGVKNYSNTIDTSKNYYDELRKRVPVTVGFNVPAFRCLEVLNIEVEYYDSDYPNGFRRSFKDQFPLPDLENSQAVHEKLKWSVYAKRTIGSHFSLIGQVANDHFIPTSHTLIMGKGSQDLQDVTLRHGDWWWATKMVVHF